MAKPIRKKRLMNKKDLKETLKPLIKECLKEALYEEGLLKNIVSQVVEGYSSAGTKIVESTSQDPAPIAAKIKPDDGVKKQLEETKKRMLSAIGGEAYGNVNVFEGTTPMIQESNSGTNPMSGVSPADPGVDISNIVNRNWGKLI